MERFNLLCVALAIAVPGACLDRSALGGTIVDSSSKVPADPRQHYARFVRFRPADGQVVTLNPPRFSWPYLPDIAMKDKLCPADQKFTLQISRDDDFANPVVDIHDTPYNFYNFLPPLEDPGPWHWRVIYNHRTDREVTSDVRRFTVAASATAWDRASFDSLLDGLTEHPRILFNRDNRAEVLAIRREHPFSDELARYMIGTANSTIEQKWYKSFPKDDKEPVSYMQMGRSLVSVAFAYLLTGDESYAGFKERMLTIASYPPGGYSSPEGAGALDKWETHLTEYMGLFYDWFYHELTDGERATVRGSLEWRIDHTLNSFAWRRNRGASVRRGSIAMDCSSHSYQNIMATLPGALAICDESEVARRAVDVGLHYLVGITNGFGEDECWNEGPGYGNGKMKWLTDATWYLQTTLPQLQLGKNEAYNSYCDFFARITPLGARHSSFGNRGLNERDWSGSRVTTMRRMAMLTGNGHAMQNWAATRQQMGGSSMPYTPWIDYVLPYYADEPEPVVEDRHSKLFGVEGWVTVSSAPPSDPVRQKDAVSMTFACRPRGGYSHAFRSENAFDIHAFGQTIAVGGGTTHNQSRFANHTMSHNTVLVGGQEQLGAKTGQPVCGRIIAFHEAEDFVYFAGDATEAYGRNSGLERFIRHVVFVGGEYFVIFDDLALANDQPPGTFQWLYHVTPEVPLKFDPETFRVDYNVDNARVVLQHVNYRDDLTFEDLPGARGMTNPITGEATAIVDKYIKPGVLKNVPKALEAHHHWISHRTPRHEMQFLSVVVPYRQDDPAPRIEPTDQDGVQVTFCGRTTVVAFTRNAKADIAIDAEAIGR